MFGENKNELTSNLKNPHTHFTRVTERKWEIEIMSTVSQSFFLIEFEMKLENARCFQCVSFWHISSMFLDYHNNS